MKEVQGTIECLLAHGTAGDGKMNRAEMVGPLLCHRDQSTEDNGRDGQDPHVTTSHHSPPPGWLCRSSVPVMHHA